MKIKESRKVEQKIQSSVNRRKVIPHSNKVAKDESTIDLMVTKAVEAKDIPRMVPEIKLLYKQFWEVIINLPIPLLQQIAAYKAVAKEESTKDFDKANLEALYVARSNINTIVTALRDLQQIIKLLDQSFPEKITQFTKLCQQLNEMSKEELASTIISEWQIEDLGLLDKIIHWAEVSRITQEEKYNSSIEIHVKEESLTDKFLNGIKPKAVSEIILPPYINYVPDTRIKSLSQLLDELVLPISSKYTSEEAKLLLEEQYQYITKVSDTWQNKSKEAIYTWALERKGKFIQNQEQICELIAVMNRANELITGGHKLRDSQILSLLVFVKNAFGLELESDNLYGRLCQIHTGEGKTTIVSLLAIIQVMQGLKVDVITSNNILARDAVTEKTDLYSLFGITVATNNPVKAVEMADGQVFNVVQVADDGNCFYHAVADQLAKLGITNPNGISYNHEELRQVAVNYVSINKTEKFGTDLAERLTNTGDLHGDLLANIHTIDEYIAIHSNNGEWADSGVVGALAQQLGITLRVYKNSEAATYNSGQGQPRTINLIYTGNHYDSLEFATGTNRIGSPDCYKADVIYGSIGNFQFDYLKDHFLEQGTSAGREFGVVVLDEVDSMLIDNGRHIAKLASPFAGMESLRYIYVKIWQTLEELTGSMSYYDLTEISISIKQQIGEDTQLLDLIPKYLQDYVERQMDQWISNAIQAKYLYKENEQYVIKISPDKGGEKSIIPVDYLSTGVSLKNTVWPNGLHQFLQLKHNLEITVETLTNSHVSNMGYIKKYGNKIYGMTGTLGSNMEKALLSKIYKVDAAEIPTYKEKNFYELPGRIIEDQQWLDITILSILQQIEEHRSVLVICETIEAVRIIKKGLELFNSLEKTTVSGILKNYIKKITIYTDDDSQVTENKIGPGEIIIATNIAGRGTDLQTTPELEENGGLHVCVTFLPFNQRVEEQAFGRTSRQGKAGTAELVIKKREVEKLGLEFSSDMDMNEAALEVIKARRADIEKERIKEVLSKASELDFQDMLCDSFIKLCKEFKYQNSQLPGLNYLLEDLKELWAFWLEKQALKHTGLMSLISSGTLLQEFVEQQLEEFKAQAGILLTGRKVDGEGKILEYSMAERIIHNPYNAVKQAEYCLQHNDLLNHSLPSAVSWLKQAIEIGGDEKITSSYLKLFESCITGNNLLAKKFANILVGIFKIEVPILSNDSYKQEAKLFLQKARTSIEKEIFYLKKLLTTGNHINPIILSTSSLISQESILKEHKLESVLEVVDYDSAFVEIKEVPIVRNHKELTQLLTTLQDINVGEVIRIVYHIKPELVTNNIEPISAILYLTKKNGNQLQISYYEPHGHKVPYKVKWELCKYCYFLEEKYNMVAEKVITKKQSITKLPVEPGVIKTGLTQQKELLAHNLLFKHLYAKIAALSLQMSNIDELIATMDSMQDDLEDLLVNRKFNTFGKVALEQEILKKSDINELINIGLGQSYTLKSITITNVEESVYNQGELLPFIDMIVNGLGLLKLAAQIPFFSKYIEQVSQLLISDGITQIAANVLNQKIDPAYLVAKVLNSLEVTNQELTGALEKTIMVAIRTCQKLTEANIALPEIDLSCNVLDDTNGNLAELEKEVNTDSKLYDKDEVDSTIIDMKGEPAITRISDQFLNAFDSQLLGQEPVYNGFLIID